MPDKMYRICSQTIMDTTADPDITFDSDGRSIYVKQYHDFVDARIPEKSTKSTSLNNLIIKIKKENKSKPYDCIIGISGGVDSTYTAWYAKKILGLRPLAVHMDNGWNSELAVSNIEKTLQLLDIELYTEVLDWNEFREIQKAYLFASTPDGEIPSDHAIWGTLYRVANKYNIKYIISGTNARTEGILPPSWAQGHIDTTYLNSVVKKFSRVKIKTFPLLSPLHLFYYIAIRQIKKVNLLDLIDYNKQEAMHILQSELGWKYYGGKHYESVYTRFYQGYILPLKFNIDKRRAHLSSLICSGEITREEALEEIKKPAYPSEELLRQDIQFVKNKLGLTDQVYDDILALPVKRYEDYPNHKWLVNSMLSIYKKIF